MTTTSVPPTILLLVHIGPILPPYLLDCILQLRRFTQIETHILVQQPHIEEVNRWGAVPNIKAVPLESVPFSDKHIEFAKKSRHNPHFRNGFWRFASERFFALYDYALQNRLENIFHIENDNLIFTDFTTKLSLFQTKPIWAVFDHPNRCIPSFMYFKNWISINLILDTFLEGAHTGQNDMSSMAKFRDKYPNIVGTLPIVDATYPDPIDERYYKYASDFGMLFDAAWIGQYIGGVDPRNMLGDTRGYINETAITTVDKIRLEWRQDGNRRRLFLNGLPLVNLHIHSKDLNGHSSNALICARDIIKGETYQAECDVYLVKGTQPNIPHFVAHQKKFKDIDSIVEKWANPVKIFCKGELIGIFQEKLLAGHITQPFILVTHNSDQNIGQEYLPVLEHPLLIHWYAQNPLITHPKLTLLPIGQANSCYKHGDASIISRVINSRPLKTKDYYFFFNTGTNRPARELCTNILCTKGLVFGEPHPYSQYVEELAKARFAICPDGNGADSHRIWEALYLGTIPIALSNSFTDQLKNAGFPIILLEKWEDLDMAKAFQPIVFDYVKLLNKLAKYNTILLDLGTSTVTDAS